MEPVAAAARDTAGNKNANDVNMATVCKYHDRRNGVQVPSTSGGKVYWFVRLSVRYREYLSDVNE